VGKKHVIQNVDDFEGESYERVITQARLGDGSEVDAYIYRLRAE